MLTCEFSFYKKKVSTLIHCIDQIACHETTNYVVLISFRDLPDRLINIIRRYDTKILSIHLIDGRSKKKLLSMSDLLIEIIIIHDRAQENMLSVFDFVKYLIKHSFVLILNATSIQYAIKSMLLRMKSKQLSMLIMMK